MIMEVNRTRDLSITKGGRRCAMGNCHFSPQSSGFFFGFFNLLFVFNELLQLLDQYRT